MTEGKKEDASLGKRVGWDEETNVGFIEISSVASFIGLFDTRIDGLLLGGLERAPVVVVFIIKTPSRMT